MAKVIEKQVSRTIGMEKPPKEGEHFRKGEEVKNATKIIDVAIDEKEKAEK